MSVSMEPRTRLAHMAEYMLNMNRLLPLEEAKIQLLRCRLVGYKLAAEIGEYDKAYIDNLMEESYKDLSSIRGLNITDPYMDPCTSQYLLLDELKSYRYRDQAEHFMVFIRAEFKKVFIPTFRLLTELCRSGKKYSWEEVKAQLQQVMDDLGLESSWEECDAYMERYLAKVSKTLGIPG